MKKVSTNNYPLSSYSWTQTSTYMDLDTWIPHTINIINQSTQQKMKCWYDGVYILNFNMEGGGRGGAVVQFFIFDGRYVGTQMFFDINIGDDDGPNHCRVNKVNVSSSFYWKYISVWVDPRQFLSGRFKTNSYTSLLCIYMF